jgi:short-subunit dehydrogenase
LAKDGSQQGESTLEEDKMMTAEEVARIIANGIENRSRTLIMTRQGKLTVLLSKFFPALLDKLVYNVFTKEKDALLK